MSEELNSPPLAEDTLSETTVAPKPPSSGVSFDSLQGKAMELLKNPIVVAGGAVIVGLVVARIAAGSKLRQVAVQALADFIKVKTVSTLLPPPPTPVEPPQTAQASGSPEPAAPANPLSQLGRQIFDSLGPQLGDLAKKKLAEFFPTKQ